MFVISYRFKKQKNIQISLNFWVSVKWVLRYKNLFVCFKANGLCCGCWDLGWVVGPAGWVIENMIAGVKSKWMLPNHQGMRMTLNICWTLSLPVWKKLHVSKTRFFKWLWWISFFFFFACFVCLWYVKHFFLPNDQCKQWFCKISVYLCTFTRSTLNHNCKHRYCYMPRWTINCFHRYSV